MKVPNEKSSASKTTLCTAHCITMRLIIVRWQRLTNTSGQVMMVYCMSLTFHTWFKRDKVIGYTSLESHPTPEYVIKNPFWNYTVGYYHLLSLKPLVLRPILHIIKIHHLRKTEIYVSLKDTLLLLKIIIWV